MQADAMGVQKPKRLKIQGIGSLIGLLLIILVLSVTAHDFLTVSNLFNVLRQVSINALIAFGMTFVILTGGIDLSVGSILALSSAVTASMMAGGTDTWLAVIVGLAAGVLMGAVNGLLVAKGRLAPFIVTLATMTVFRGLTLVYTDGKPVTGLNEDFAFMGKGYFLQIPMPIIWMIIAFAVLYIILRHTTFGRRVYAVGSNEEATWLSGISTSKVKVLVYSISGLMAALSGLILTSRLNICSAYGGRCLRAGCHCSGCAWRNKLVGW